MIDRLREAAEALNDGDPTPLVALMDDDVDWRGVSRGFMWWKHTPS
jgi:ketosteroid isomerase-like protein